MKSDGEPIERQVSTGLLPTRDQTASTGTIAAANFGIELE